MACLHLSAVHNLATCIARPGCSRMLLRQQNHLPGFLVLLPSVASSLVSIRAIIAFASSGDSRFKGPWLFDLQLANLQIALKNLLKYPLII
ncbi:hypothetical protein GQ55_9G252600 [Panicum hallii var. hallii]|uniref:Uncharacterized protein n=1 Tax=Panicum hallii var. hallii TaxID=1504633 RepID=A0A2T7C6X9_9POAL|nr:hypothetical protein GQ55_9G252600 [Panicum hallii var. hallii]